MNDNKTKETLEMATDKKCVCVSMKGLFIPNRQLSVAVSACIMMLFFSFIAGYFFGEQHAAQNFMRHVDHISFNDQMSASLCVLAKECTLVNANGNDDSINQDASDSDDNSFQECIANIVDNDLAPVVQEIQKHYYAQLIGFGTQQAAQRFAKKLESRNIPVEINKHCSRTAKGKTVNWYQVITLPYDDKQKLLELVDAIQKTEKIQDARIVTC